MKARIYMDHASATPLDGRVRDRMEPYGEMAYGNPSALHTEGRMAKIALDESRAIIAGILHARPQELVFTGSGTESANLAIQGTVASCQLPVASNIQNRVHFSGNWKLETGNFLPHVITSVIEHHAVLEPIRDLEKRGVITATYLPVDADGRVDPRAVKAALRSETVLVSIMYANNEIGTIQPTAEIAKVIRNWKKENGAPGRDTKEGAAPAYPYFHTDACQAGNYLSLDVEKLGVDLMTLNGAKIYGPKGTGLLYVREGVQIEPVMRGGGHEMGLRAGTENVAGIVGFARALKLTGDMRETESVRLSEMRDHFAALIKEHIPEAVINGGMENRLPNNLNITLIPREGTVPRQNKNLWSNIIPDHEFLAIALDERGIACSTKSACDERDAETSHVLLALRDAAETPDLPASGLRFSLGRSSTADDVIHVVDALKDILEIQRTTFS